MTETKQARSKLREFEVVFFPLGRPAISEPPWDFEMGDELVFRCNAPLKKIVLRPSLPNLFEPKALEPKRTGPKEFKLRLPDLDAVAIDEGLMQHNEECICWFRFDIYFEGQPPDRAVLNEKIGRLRPRSDGKRTPAAKSKGGVLDESLDPGPAGDRILENIQCNIIKGTTREFGKLLMVRFTGGAVKKRREWLANFADKVVTSALEQKQIWKESRSDALGSIALSAAGYTALGLRVPPDDSPEKEFVLDAGDAPEDPEFLAGMRETGVTYKTRWDAALDYWEGKYRNCDIHLCVLLYDDDKHRLANTVADLEQEIAKVGEIVAEESGKRHIHKKLGEKETIEHFGFTDGLSNPKLIKGEQKPGKYWPSGTAPLKLVLTQEPALPGKKGGKPTYGSYLAFLKMEQNVRKFKQAAAELSKALGKGTPADAAALAMGRKTDGTPLEKTGKGPNDFNYDHEDSKCPFHAHVRRMNPRKEDSFGLVRRSMHYGPERVDLYPRSKEEPPDGGVGLLFLSYQSRIQSFSSRMAAANRPIQGGVDAMIGAKRFDRGEELDGRQTWPGEVPFLMADFVTPMGGEYFFCPSISFFKNLPSVAAK